MLEQFCVSVVVPFYNSAPHIKTCLDALLNQDFDMPFEIIMVDDASTDIGQSIVKTYDIPNLKLYSLSSNSGPATARNFGLKKAKGKYIFFLDVDDTIDPNTLKILYSVAAETSCDLVFCDSKWIENSKNQRSNIFSYSSDKAIESSELTKTMQRRLYNPKHMGGPLSCKGRLIKHSIIFDNKILFDEKLRYLEDEIFMWDVLAFVQTVMYVHNQLYTYYVHPNVDTAVARGLSLGFPVSKFKLITTHIQNSFKQRGCSTMEIKRFGDQAFIYFIINVLISYTKSMMHGKLDLKSGTKCRRKIIDDILADPEVSIAIRNYSCSKEESSWIPRAIAWRSTKLLEFACNRRAKEILRLRRKN